MIADEDELSFLLPAAAALASVPANGAKFICTWESRIIKIPSPPPPRQTRMTLLAVHKGTMKTELGRGITNKDEVHFFIIILLRLNPGM